MERFARMDAADMVATSVSQKDSTESPSLSLPSRKAKDGSSTASKRSSSARETELAVQQVRHQIASNAKNQKNDLVRIGQDLLLQQLRQQRKGI
ncbi:hypothetical protein ADEAN_000301700 [Angomonas deanei]|uniref:Uncharacterized protein n=1 Tax=Angomonas deanei TaxID=59799 RepID=A0A7G2CBW8_9TRYP|nr:hypothetical protein ADEAN_000301700 [Angomonas deanei]